MRKATLTMAAPIRLRLMARRRGESAGEVTVQIQRGIDPDKIRPEI